jgi:trehalose synthase
VIVERVKVKTKNINNYRSIVGSQVITELKKMSQPLRGRRVIHLNSTAVGGGVAEILQSLVPLQRSLGLKSDWYIVKPPAKFFLITKKFHNALQGAKIRITRKEFNYYLTLNRRFGQSLQKLSADLFIIHDPQPLASWHFTLRSFSEGGLSHRPKAISRIHIDLSTPNKQLLEFLLPYLKEYDKVIFSLRSFVPQGLPKSKVAIIPPAIDPLTVKNKPLDRQKARAMLERLGIKLERPLIAQISRFDPWKDQPGVIQAYRLAKKHFPQLQLVLLGNATAKDDPESQFIFKQVQRFAHNDPDIFLINKDSNLLVNALQLEADIILQKSLREGFGLTATEALWKGKPVIAGRTGGLKLQISHLKNGLLVDSPVAAGRAIIKLLENKQLGRRLGRAAHRTVLKNYLITRLIRDHHRLYRSLLV